MEDGGHDELWRLEYESSTDFSHQISQEFPDPGNK